MPTTQDTARLLALKRKIEALSPADQLRVAAGCLDEGQYEIAETLVRNIGDDLEALRRLRGTR